MMVIIMPKLKKLRFKEPIPDPNTTNMLRKSIKNPRAHDRIRIDIRKNEFGGSVVEYALILGFALLLFIMIVGIVFAIIKWTETNFQSLISDI